MDDKIKNIQSSYSPLKLEDGQIFQDKKELVHFVMIMLAMNFMYFLCAITTK